MSLKVMWELGLTGRLCVLLGRMLDQVSLEQPGQSSSVFAQKKKAAKSSQRESVGMSCRFSLSRSLCKSVLLFLLEFLKC